MHRTLAPLALGALAVLPAHAENSKPQPVPFTDTIPAARDVAFPGTVTLDIDATDTRRGIFTTHETISGVSAGHMVLLFPKWLPGSHSPTGQIDKLAGLHISANGQEIAWTRDPVDVYAFHIDVPQGASALDIKLQFLSATKSDQGSIVMSQNLLRLQWNSMSLYPAGYFTRQIPVQATVKYPDGWTAASGLPSTATGSTYRYQPTNYEVLVDSPVLAGRYYKKWALSPRVNLDVFADNAAELAATPEQIAAHERLVTQAVKLFGAQHYDTYEFLLAISDQIGGIGLEHHRSSEDGVKLGYFLNWKDGPGPRNLLPHEYTHSWDGKFRRGAELWTPDFRAPMIDNSLWVYEGQTQFWGYVLQARSGIVSKQDTLDMYASILASLDNRPGRNWKPLIDTTNDPTMSQRRPRGWVSYQRSEDYYNEGLLVWMEVDSILRRESKGKKSIDDFARAFFGLTDGDYGEVTYTFDDVAKTLDQIVPYDWAGLLHKRLTETGAPAPISGFAANGYKLVYTEEPSPASKDSEKTRKITDLSYSLGVTIGKDAEITAVGWNTPAFKAALTPGDTIVAVNGAAYTDAGIKAAITAAKTASAPIALMVKHGTAIDTVTIDYHGGLRYPHLEKIGSGEGGLDRLLQPR
ncbi:M61 family metallopeptidase [Sphingomonas sp. NFR15]|uniref:M61 family metallopeptidase n=1 Tax=Sphingomonas sp. NFR15 TaxID=1566282 RepID=UPI000889212E|nr:M61 family metallopeptidase [Sphingomonas sp. NFR15]SDA36752.1 Predicted metalloprotease, contains C-terminal PDZ domain [Sphingomonas sp. NFR15]